MSLFTFIFTSNGHTFSFSGICLKIESLRYNVFTHARVTYGNMLETGLRLGIFNCNIIMSVASFCTTAIFFPGFVGKAHCARRFAFSNDALDLCATIIEYWNTLSLIIIFGHGGRLGIHRCVFSLIHIPILTSLLRCYATAVTDFQ